MKSLETQVVEELKILEKNFPQTDQLKKFEETNQNFEELVNKGIAKKRGNNLLSATDAHIKKQAWFNTGT